MNNCAVLLARVFSLIPALSGIFTSLCLYKLQGSPGLLRWTPKYAWLLALFPLASFVPAILFMLSQRSDVLFALALILSVGITAAYAWGSRIFFRAIHAEFVGVPAIHRYDPSVDRPLVRLAFGSDVHVGQPGANKKATERILEAVNSGGFDAFFILGDIAEIGFPGSDLEDAARLLSAKGPGARLTNVPLVTLMGNHDSLVGGEYRYRKIFNPDLYFRIDSGHVHIIALNILWDTGSFDRTQRAWLKRNLESIPKSDTTIVITHAFIRASGHHERSSNRDWFDSKPLIRDLAPILEQGGVDLVVSGHNHFMEYLEAPDGAAPARADLTGSLSDGEDPSEPAGKLPTAYAIVGTMGGKMDPPRTYVSDSSKWYLADQTGFLDVDLSGGCMKLTFRDETGKPLHEITRQV